jgi:hypothetical protein
MYKKESIKNDWCGLKIVRDSKWCEILETVGGTQQIYTQLFFAN